MTNSIIIRIHETSYELNENTRLQWRVISSSADKNQELEVLGTIEDFSDYYKSLCMKNKGGECSYTVVLMLPNTMVFYKNLQLSEKQKKHLATAIPYCIEEYLTENIENMHIQNIALKDSDFIGVCAVANSLMQQCIDIFEQYLLPLDSIIAESQCYESVEADSIILLADNNLIIISENSCGLNIDTKIVADYIQSLVNKSLEENLQPLGYSKKTNLKLILKYTNSATKEDITKITAIAEQYDLEIKTEQLEDSLFDYLINNYLNIIKKQSAIELRSGTYRCLTRRNKIISRWRSIAIALCCWLVIDITISIGFSLAYAEKKHSIWKMNIEKYLTLFPKDQQASRAYQKKDYRFDTQKMLKNRLKTDQANINSDDLFLIILRDVSVAIHEVNPDLIPEKIDFSADSKTTKIYFNNIDIKEELEKIKLSIKKHGLEVNIDAGSINDMTCLLVDKKL